MDKFEDYEHFGGTCRLYIQVTTLKVEAAGAYKTMALTAVNPRKQLSHW
jgi:hypothetical protein